MRTEKRSAFLSGLCGVAVALGLAVSAAHGTVTTERGASILAFPKVLSEANVVDTIIQITNTSNSMVHAHCFYVNAAKDYWGVPQWQVTDFVIWLTKQQPTHWQVSAGRLVNPADTCIDPATGKIDPALAGCDGAGIDPGAIPPVPDSFEGELKCVEVDSTGNPSGGNHLKGEATVLTIDTGVGHADVAKYNAIGIIGTDLAGTGDPPNVLLLDQPSDDAVVVGQYNACPNALLLNHLAEGVTDPIIYTGVDGIAPLGGTCSVTTTTPCMSDDDCPAGEVCDNGPRILDATGVVDLRSTTVTDLTVIPCNQDFENAVGSAVTIQFQIFNEFEERFSASTTVDCWEQFYLFQVDSPNDPERSVFSFNTLGTTAAFTRILPVTPAGDFAGGVLAVAGVTRADALANRTRVALNVFMEGDRLDSTDKIDKITLPYDFGTSGGL